MNSCMGKLFLLHLYQHGQIYVVIKLYLHIFGLFIQNSRKKQFFQEKKICIQNVFQYLEGWLLSMASIHFKAFLSVLLPHPAPESRATGHWLVTIDKWHCAPHLKHTQLSFSGMQLNHCGDTIRMHCILLPACLPTPLSGDQLNCIVCCKLVLQRQAQSVSGAWPEAFTRKR